MVKPRQAWPHFQKPLGLSPGGFVLYGLFHPKNSIDRPLRSPRVPLGWVVAVLGSPRIERRSERQSAPRIRRPLVLGFQLPALAAALKPLDAHSTTPEAQPG